MKISLLPETVLLCLLAVPFFRPATEQIQAQSGTVNSGLRSDPISLPRLAIASDEGGLRLNYWPRGTNGLLTILASEDVEKLLTNGIVLRAEPISPVRQGSLLLTNWRAARRQFFQLREEATNAPPASATDIPATPFFTRSIQPSGGSQTIECGEQVRVTIPAGALSSAQTLTVGAAPPNPALRSPVGLSGGKIYEIKLGDLPELNAPITVEIPYDPSFLNPDLPLSNAVTVAFWLPEERLWSVQPSVVDPKRQVLLFETIHYLTDVGSVFVARDRQAGPSEKRRFILNYPAGVSAQVSTNLLDSFAFTNLVGELFEQAYEIYTNSFTPPTTPIWVFIDSQYSEGEWGGLTGNILLPTKFLTADDLKVTVGHELFHAVQNRYYNAYAAGTGNRKWWHEASAQYAGQVLFAGNGPPFDANQYLQVDFLQLPLITVDKSHEYAAANFLDFLFRESKGKVTFQGQFDALESYSLTESVLDRLDRHVKTQTGQALQDFYRSFAADFAFNASGYAPGQDPWGPAATGSSRIGKMAPDIQELTVPFQLAAGYSALLYALKMESAPGTSEAQYKILIKDPDPKAVLDVFRLPQNLRQSSRPSPYLSSAQYAAKTGTLELARPTLKNGEYLAFVGSNARTDTGATVTFMIERVVELKVTITFQKIGDYEWSFTADVSGGYPPYSFFWSADEPRLIWNHQPVLEPGTTNPVVMTARPELSNTVGIYVSVSDFRGNTGTGGLLFTF